MSDGTPTKPARTSPLIAPLLVIVTPAVVRPPSHVCQQNRPTGLMVAHGLVRTHAATRPTSSPIARQNE